METVSINTTQNINIDFKLAGLFDRILAFLIDAIILVAYYILTSYLAGRVFGSVAIVFWIFNGLLMYLYFLLSEIFMDGQTLGKKALDIKVVKLDGTQPSVGSYILRWIMIPVDHFISGAIAMVMIIFTRNNQRVGDVLAGTTVIKLSDTKNTLQQKKQLFSSIEGDYIPSFPEAASLTSKDLQLIDQAIEAFRKSGHRQPVNLLKIKMEQKLQIKSDLPAIKFLHTITRDHHYYASR